MHIALTVSQVVLLCAAIWIMQVAVQAMHNAQSWARLAEKTAMQLRSERDRVTTSERELDALRRELRKLSGKFYQQQREILEEAADLAEANEPLGVPALRVCENWELSQTLGPRSEAASCECDYCTRRREHRRALRAALVPKTVQGQAEVAKLNAGKA